MFKKTIKKSNLKENLEDSPLKPNEKPEELELEPKLRKKLKTSQYTVKNLKKHHLMFLIKRRSPRLKIIKPRFKK